MTQQDQIQALKLLQRIDQLTEVNLDHLDEYCETIVKLQKLITDENLPQQL
jgi:hypothetical protein